MTSPDYMYKPGLVQRRIKEDTSKVVFRRAPDRFAELQPGLGIPLKPSPA